MTGATLDDARTVIALLDQSPLDECAARYAERMARPAGRLLLSRVLPSRSRTGGAPQAAQAAAAHQYLDVLARRLVSPCQTDTRVSHGNAAEAILEQLSEHKANLVVMAMPAGHGFADRTAGSVAVHVLTHSAVPVCVVRPGHGLFGPRRVAASPRVLVPLDGSQFAEAALPEACKLASVLGGELVLLRVVPLVSSLPPPGALGWDISALDRLEAEAWPYLRNVAERCTGVYSCLCRTEVRLGASAEAILGAVDDEPAAAVVMATHAHSGWQRVLMGSVTDHVLRMSTVPVELVGPCAFAAGVAQNPPAAAQHLPRPLRPSYRL